MQKAKKLKVTKIHSICCGAILSLLMTGTSCTPDENEKLIVTRQDSTSYSLGVSFAEKIPQNLKDNNIENVEFDYFIQGIVDYFDSTQNLKLTKEEITTLTAAVFNQQRENEQKQYVAENEVNIAKGDAFLERNKKNPDVIEIRDGLQYQIVDMGWGKMSPLLTDTIYINFKVYNTKSELLYDSRKRSDPTKIYLGSAIPALQETLTKIRTGGTIKVFTSHEHAYGSVVYKNDLVKPYETLIFEVTLTKIRLNSERLAEFYRLVKQEQNANINNTPNK